MKKGKIKRATSGNALEHEIHELWWPPVQLLKDKAETNRTNLADYIKDDPRNGNQSDDWGFVFSEAEYGDCDRSTQEKLVKHIQASCAEQGFSMTVHTWANKGEERGTLRIRLKCSHNRRTRCKFSFQLCYGLTECFWYLRRGGGNHVHSNHVLEKPKFDGSLKRSPAKSKKREPEEQKSPGEAMFANGKRSASPAMQSPKKPRVDLPQAAAAAAAGPLQSMVGLPQSLHPSGYPSSPANPYSSYPQQQPPFAYPAPVPPQEDKTPNPPALPAQHPNEHRAPSSEAYERRNRFLKSQGANNTLSQSGLESTSQQSSVAKFLGSGPLDQKLSFGGFPLQHGFTTGRTLPHLDMSRQATVHTSNSSGSGVLGELPPPKSQAPNPQTKNEYSSSCNFLLASSASLQQAIGELPEILASTASLPRPEEEEPKHPTHSKSPLASPQARKFDPVRHGGSMSPRFNRSSSPRPGRTASPHPRKATPPPPPFHSSDPPKDSGKRSPMYPPAMIETQQKHSQSGLQGLSEYSAPPPVHPHPVRAGGRGAAPGSGLLPDHTTAPPRHLQAMKGKDRGASRVHSTFFSSIDTFAFSSAGSLNDSSEDINKLEGFGGGTPAKKKEEPSDEDNKPENGTSDD